MTKGLLTIEKGIIQWWKSRVRWVGAQYPEGDYRGTHEVVMLPGKEYTLVA